MYEEDGIVAGTWDVKDIALAARGKIEAKGG